MKNENLFRGKMFPAGRFVEEEAYWLNKLSGELEKSNFPYDNPAQESSGHSKYRYETVECILSPAAYSSLIGISSGSHLRLHIVLTAGLVLLLHKYTGRENIIVGMPIYRQNPGQDGAVRFVNTILALQNRVDVDRTFKDLVLQVRQTITEAVEHVNYPLERLLYRLNLSSDREHDFPLFDIACLLENIQDEQYLQDIRLNMIFIFSLDEKAGRLAGRVKYNPLRYKKETAAAIAHRFVFLMQEILQRIERPLTGFSLMSQEEAKRLTRDFNNTAAHYPAGKTVQQLFEEQAERNPGHTALLCRKLDGSSNEVSYRELNELSNRLAVSLRKRGVTSNSIVALIVEPSLEMAVGVLGVLKAGGAYLPIDTGTPPGRVSTILTDAGAALVLCDHKTLQKHSFTALQQLLPDTSDCFFTGACSSINDLDSLPFPDRSLISYEKYRRYIGQALVKNSISIQATRGCPFNCAYCHKIWPAKHYFRSAENILEELLIFYNIGVRRFVFVDDIFNLNIENSRRFFQLIIKNKLAVQLFFPNGMRGDLLTGEYIDLLVEAGVVDLTLALETASPRLQRLIKKNLRLEKLEQNLEYLCKKYPQLILELQTMHGFPTETEKEALATLDFIKRQHWIHFPYINILKIYPNTNMMRIALENGISPVAIRNSEHLAHHELPDTLPFDKNFTLQYQAGFLNEYFLAKERLLKILPYQMEVLTEDEIIQKYNSYLPTDITCINDILQLAGISSKELKKEKCIPESAVYIPDIDEKIASCFKPNQPGAGALRILLLDLSQFFSSESRMLYDVVDSPLGLMYVLTYLQQRLGNKIHGRIIKSRIDFDSYAELRELLERFRPDVIGMRTLIFYKDFFHKTAALIRQWGIDVPLIAGGPYATSSFHTIVQDRNIDLVVVGEGEATFCELITHILDNEKKLPGKAMLKKIPGLAYAGGEDGTAPNDKSGRQIYLLDCNDFMKEDKPGTREPIKNLSPVNTPDDPVYAVFTSGSTGKPKGVLVEQKGLVNYLCWAAKHYVKNERIGFPLSTPLSFDLTVTAFFVPLVTGNMVIIYEGEEKEALIGRALDDDQVNALKATPSHLRSIKDKQIESSNLRRLIVGGEAFHCSLARDISRKFKESVEIYNEYGPTEAVVGCMLHLFDGSLDCVGDVPIGAPADNMRIYLLDARLHPVPPGVAGDIYISGIGLARGYLNRPELTAEKFLLNHNRSYGSNKSYIIYRTGDIGCFLADGTMQYAGRVDNQVKIRGYRIEPGEIEMVLLRHKEIKEAVVSVGGGAEDDLHIYAFIVPLQAARERFADIPAAAARLRSYLSAALPAYMIPDYFIPLDHIPLSASGKIDGKNLMKAGMELLKSRSSSIYEQPRDEKETICMQVWQEVLNIERLGVNDNFFEIGGDSIKAIQISTRLKNRQLILGVNDIFSNPTIRGSAKYIRSQEVDADRSPVTGEVDLTPAQWWFFKNKFIHPHHFNQAVMLKRENPREFQEAAVHSVFDKIIEHHDALRMIFHLEENHVRQFNRNLEGRFYSLDVVDLMDEVDPYPLIDREAAGIQQEIDFERGTLVKLVIFKTRQGDYLLIVIHHLVVDGVSWRILLEDIDTGFRQLEKREEVQFPPKSTSFRTWARKLKEYANDKSLLKEMDYWSKLADEKVQRLPVDRPIDESKQVYKYAQRVILELEKEDTTKLLTGVNRAYNTEINDILLTALGMALKQWRNIEKTFINLEYHGRQSIIEEIDINRTVGWFTSQYPFLLDISAVKDRGHAIKNVKESLHRVPNKGIGYGILRYLALKEEQGRALEIAPEISFNYLGQFDTGYSGECFFSVQRLNTGGDISPALERKYLIEISGISTSGRLNLSFIYNSLQYDDSTINNLVEFFRSNLLEIIRHCSERKESELTPRDIAVDEDLSIEEFESIKEFVRLKVEE